MKSQEEIKELKQISMIGYLENKGITPISKNSDWLMYHSPLREDNNPSFGVNLVYNTFNDLGSGEKGNIIELVMKLENIDFVNACNFLGSVDYLKKKVLGTNFFSLNSQSIDINPNALQIQQVKPLQSNSLIAYCESRKIPFHIAFKFLHEIHCSNNSKSYYSLGFKNDKGGFELRNQLFKGCTAPKGITTFEVQNSNSIYLFEGFFDFLSALSFFGTSKPLNTVIVLNSLVNLSQAKEWLNNAETIHSFLDRDKQGIATVEKLTNEGRNVVDRSIIYHGFKDFNDLLVSN